MIAARPAFLSLLFIGVLGAGAGCNNYTHQLERGQSYYEQNDYERALALWRNLEDDDGSLSDSEYIRYCYLRGMTDYRLKYRHDARYWLGLAKAGVIDLGSGLNEDEMARLSEALDDLNASVYGIEKSSKKTASKIEDDSGFGKKCKWTSECDEGFICQSGSCVQLAK